MCNIAPENKLFAIDENENVSFEGKIYNLGTILDFLIDDTNGIKICA